MNRDRTLAITMMAVAVASVPAWLMVGGIRDPNRDSSIAAYIVGFAVFAGAVALCFLAAGGFALRSDRPLARAGVVAGAIAGAHLAAWYVGERFDATWQILAAYVAIGALTAAAIAPWRLRESRANRSHVPE